MKYIAFLFVIALLIVLGWVVLRGGITQPTSTPVPSVSATPTSEPEANIKVFSPEPNDEVGLPITITGEARVFEGTFQYRLIDGDGTVLIERSAMTSGEKGMGEFDSFEVSFNYPAPKGLIGMLEVFEYSPKDGLETNKVSVPVQFKIVESPRIIKVYYSNTEKNPNAADCSLVYPLNRRIPKTDTPARASIEELLLGPAYGEGKDGYITNINGGVKIQKLTIESGVAKVDFDETLERAVGGSCRVAAIRAQITQTLKQFASVKSVLISINGRTEDILQP